MNISKVRHTPFPPAKLSIIILPLIGGCAGSGDEEHSLSGEPARALVDGQGSPTSSAPALDRAVVENEADLVPLAKIDLPNKVTITFYEPEPGGLLTIETGPVGSMRTAAADEKLLDASQKFERLSGKKAPSVLVDAVQRAKAAAVTRQRAPRDSEAPTTPIAAPMTKALNNDRTHESFVSYYCRTVADNWANWVWVTGYGNTGTWNDKYLLRSAALAVFGEIRHVVRKRPWFTWEDVSRVFVPQGWYNAVEYTRPSVDFDTNVYVDNADGDTYDACTEAWNP